MDFTNGEFPSQVYCMDQNPKDSKQQKRSVKSYATRVFQESTIGIVASIASSHSNARRLFKSIVLILCITGFSYQCITYLLHVFEFPTSVDIDIQKPDDFNSPGFTFCNNNEIKRSVFCDKFPDRCYQPLEKFCSKFHDYCGNNGSTLVPKKEYFDLEDSLTFDEIIQLGIDDKSEFLPIDRNGGFWNDTRGPYIRTKRDGEGVMLCYTLHSVVDTPEYPRNLRHLNPFSSKPMPSTTLTFSVRQDEMLVPGNRAGVLFSIHSPYEAVNPFDKGIFLKPGRNYRIYVYLEEEMLLEKPFSTNCFNYVEAWEANNRTGPRIQQMCQEKCMMEAYVGCFDCVSPEVLYPSAAKMCKADGNYTECPDEVIQTLVYCARSCKDDCEVTKYTHEVMERYQVDTEKTEDLEAYDQYVTVEILVEAGEVKTFKHGPKYLNVEVYSSIGGFIGCWLGISLMDIIDVLASVFSVSRYSFRKYGKQ